MTEEQNTKEKRLFEAICFNIKYSIYISVLFMRLMS